MSGRLYHGDNLQVLREHVDGESVDLVYLDPPFQSGRDYHLLFETREGATSRIEAFGDRWLWGPEPAAAFEEVVAAGGSLSTAMEALQRILPGTDMLAYLSMIAPRLTELRRVMRPTASIFLHCDPTASHYLKLLMDAVFGPDRFRNEIVWRRTGAHGKARRFAPIHDVILFYTWGHDYRWRPAPRPYMMGHVEQYFVQDSGGWRTRYYGNVLTGSGIRGGESGKPWRGFDPTAKGRHWAIPGKLLEGLDEDFSGLSQHEKMDRLLELGAIRIDPEQAWPVYERSVQPDEGTPAPDIWAYQPYTEGTVFGTDRGIDADVRWLTPQDRERIGYPTQKPLGLLARIIESSTDEGDTVLDPFCGCGTTLVAAQGLGRHWLGIDIADLALELTRTRLDDAFGGMVDYEVR